MRYVLLMIFIVHVYSDIDTLEWIYSKSYAPEYDELIVDEENMVRKLSTAKRESLDSNILRHQEIPEFAMTGPENRYMGFKYPTKSEFDTLTDINDKCQSLYLGPPQRHYVDNRICYMKDDKLVKLELKSNNMWCSVPYNASHTNDNPKKKYMAVSDWGYWRKQTILTSSFEYDYKIETDRKDVDDNDELEENSNHPDNRAYFSSNTWEAMMVDQDKKIGDFVKIDKSQLGLEEYQWYIVRDKIYGQPESPRQAVARILKELEIYADEDKNRACDEWNTISTHGIKYAVFEGGMCEDYGWDTPSKYDCDPGSVMMKWWSEYEHQPLIYMCGGKIYYSPYEDDAPDLVNTPSDWDSVPDLFNDIAIFNGLIGLIGDIGKSKALLDHLDLFAFGTIKSTLHGGAQSIVDWVEDGHTSEDPQAIDAALQHIYCGDDTDCRWQRYYVPFSHIDHYTRIGGPVGTTILVDREPHVLCKLDVRNMENSMTAMEVINYNWIRERIVQAQVSLRTWANNDCTGSGLCMLGTKEIKKTDLGVAMPLFVIPVDIGYSYYNLELKGFTLVYSKNTHMSYCYNMEEEEATLAGVKVSVSPLGFDKYSGSTSKLAKGWEATKTATKSGLRSIKRGVTNGAKNVIYKTKQRITQKLMRKASSDSYVAVESVQTAAESAHERLLKRLANRKAGKVVNKVPEYRSEKYQKMLERGFKQSQIDRIEHRRLLKEYKNTAETAKKFNQKARFDRLHSRIDARHLQRVQEARRKTFRHKFVTMLHNGASKVWKAMKFTYTAVRFMWSRGYFFSKPMRWLGRIAYDIISYPAWRFIKLIDDKIIRYDTKRMIIRQLNMNARLQSRKRLLSEIKDARIQQNLATTKRFKAQKNQQISKLGKIDIPAMQAEQKRLMANLQKRRIQRKPEYLKTQQIKGLTEMGGRNMKPAKQVLSPVVEMESALKADLSSRHKLAILEEIMKKRANIKDFFVPKPQLKLKTMEAVATSSASTAAKSKEMMASKALNVKKNIEKHRAMNKRLQNGIKNVQQKVAKNLKQQKQARQFQKKIAESQIRSSQRNIQRIQMDSAAANNLLQAQMVQEKLSRVQYHSYLKNMLSGATKNAQYYHFWRSYRQNKNQPGVQRFLGRKIPNSHDPPPYEDPADSLYAPIPEKQSTMELLNELKIMGSMTRENFWYELGFCTDTVCPFMKKHTGFLLSNNHDILKTGTYGRYQWDMISIEIEIFMNSVKGLVFRASNMDSTLSGWERTLWNGQTQLYVPGVMDSLIFVGGVAAVAQLFVISIEKATGASTMYMRNKRYTSVNTIFQSINPTDMHDKICLTDSYGDTLIEDMNLRPIEQSCSSLFDHTRKLKLEFPSVEKFIECPLTHYWDGYTCTKYEDTSYKPLVQVEERYLLEEDVACLGGLCDVEIKRDVPHTKFGSLKEDTNYMIYHEPDFERITKGFKYSLEDVGIIDSIHAHPYIGNSREIPLSIISDGNCERFGLSKIFDLNSEHNEHIEDQIKTLFQDREIAVDSLYIIDTSEGVPKLYEDIFEKKTKYNMFKKSEIRYGGHDIEMEDRVPADTTPYNYSTHKLKVNSHPYIPYGVAIVPHARDTPTNRLYITQKQRGRYGVGYANVYGKPPDFDPKCTDEYKCICFKGDEYRYVVNEDKPQNDTDYWYTYQHVQTIEECTVAAFVSTSGIAEFQTYHDIVWYNNFYPFFKTSSEDNEFYDIKVVQDPDRVFGCQRVWVNNGYQYWFNDLPYTKSYSLGMYSIPTFTYKDTDQSFTFQTIYKVIRAKKFKIQEHENIFIKKPIKVITTTEFMTAEQQATRIKNPPGRYLYDSGIAYFPIEREYTPIKYKPEDTADLDPDKDDISDNGRQYLHEINGTELITYRYMLEKETYTVINDGLIEKMEIEGTRNYAHYGEQEDVYVYIEDVNIDYNYDIQIVEEVVYGVVMLLDHQFEHVGNLRKDSRPTFGDVDNDGCPDLIIADSERSRHYYDCVVEKHELADSKFDNVYLGKYITPAFSYYDEDAFVDLLTGNSYSGEIKLYINNFTDHIIPGHELYDEVNDYNLFVHDQYFPHMYGTSAVIYETKDDSKILYVGNNNNVLSYNERCILEDKNEDVTNMVIALDKNTCNSVQVTWDDGLDMCIVDNFDKTQCENLKAKMDNECKSSSFEVILGFMEIPCHLNVHWTGTDCIVADMLSQDDCDNFKSSWHDKICLQWDYDWNTPPTRDCTADITCFNMTKNITYHSYDCVRDGVVTPAENMLQCHSTFTPSICKISDTTYEGLSECTSCQLGESDTIYIGLDDTECSNRTPVHSSGMTDNGKNFVRCANDVGFDHTVYFTTFEEASSDEAQMIMDDCSVYDPIFTEVTFINPEPLCTFGWGVSEFMTEAQCNVNMEMVCTSYDANGNNETQLDLSELQCFFKNYWTQRKTNCMWSDPVQGDVSLLGYKKDNIISVITDSGIKIWDETISGFKTFHEQKGYPAFYKPGHYLIGKEDKVEHYIKPGDVTIGETSDDIELLTVDKTGLVTVPHMDIFEEGKLTGGAVNIDLIPIPCRALAVSDQSYYLDENQVLKSIPTHEFLDLSSDGITDRVCGHLPETIITNATSCTESFAFPNTCPEGYGLVHSEWDGSNYNHNKEYDIPFIRGKYTQCAPCPPGTVSPDGHTRCLGAEFKLSNTNLFIDAYEPINFPTHLQQYHHNKGDAYFPTMHTQDGIDYIDNEVYSDTKFLICNSGFVPKQKGPIPDLSLSSDIKGDLLSHYIGTCSGYTCQRCPVNFIEQKQRCVQCPPGTLAGWEVNRYTGNNTHYENSCIRINTPIGHFMDVQNPNGVIVDNVWYPYTTHCDHWIYHPAGDIGAYQDETNQYMCKTTESGSKAVIDTGTRIVTTWNAPGQKVSNDRTRAINCEEYEVCDGEQIIGCKPGYIWFKQTNNREDEECVKCNEDESIYALHTEMDDYEYCDGTHMYQCDLASYTEGEVLDGDYSKRYVGVRDTWRGSNLVQYHPQSDISLDGSKQYVYKPDWDIEKARVQDNLPWETTYAHLNVVNALAVHGDKVVSGTMNYSDSESLKMWDKTAGSYIVLSGQSGIILSIDIAHDGRIVSSSSDGSVALWSSLGNLEWISYHHGSNGNSNEVTSVAFSPDGTQIVSGGVDGSLIVQDLYGNIIQTLTGHEDEVHAVAWGDFIVSGGRDKAMKWVDGVSTLINATNVLNIAIHGSTVIAASGDTIYIHDGNLNTVNAYGDVMSLAFSPDGSHFVSAGYSIQVWDINGGVHRQMPPLEHRLDIEAYGHKQLYSRDQTMFRTQNVLSVAWGDEIVSGGYDRTIRMWKDWNRDNHTQIRLDALSWNLQTRCLPVPDEYFAMDHEWKLHSCGYPKDKCIHRTFHRVYPFIQPTDKAPKYMFTQAVRETSYDEIFRFTDRQCLDGYLKDGCLKEYCSREGQTNCWCGEEEDFCTMACVDGMCVPACSDQVCDPDYEICYGLGDSGRCARICVGPTDNFCVTDEGGLKMCRHYNEDWNSTRLQSLDPTPDSPCFDYMPNLPETQCENVFAQECFCNRDFLDNKHNTCLHKKIEPQCSVPQDDGTCTYMPQEDLTKRDCVCGNELTEQTCYQKEGKCGVHATVLQDCSDLLSTMSNTRIDETTSKCRPIGEESLVNSNQCRLATSIKKSFGTWIHFSETFTCEGEEYEEPGCIDPFAENYNIYAVIPKECEYL